MHRLEGVRMSRCRCGEIGKYTSYKKTLELYQTELDACDDMLVNIKDDLTRLKEKVGIAYYASNISSTVNWIGNLDTGMNSVKATYQEKINTRLEEIYSILSHLNAEDAEFHKEEEEQKLAMENYASDEEN